LTDPSDTSLSLTKTLNSAGTVSFYYNVANFGGSFNNPDFTFQIDGVTQGSFNSITGGFTLGSFAVSSGTHTLKWDLHYHNSTSMTVYIDDLTLTNAGAGTAALFNGGKVGIGTSFPNATLDVTGNVHIQAGTDSTSELQIQSANAADTLFTVDTTNNKLVLF
jgi:hypothetical protein